MLGKPLIAVDLETTGLDVHRALVCVLALSDGQESKVFPCYQGIIPEEAKAILTQANTWITHNGTAFDLQILRREGIPWPKYHYDTLIGELIFATDGSRKDFSASLANTLKRRLGEDTKGEVNHQEWSLIHPPTPEQEAYVKADVASLHRLMWQQGIDASNQGFDEALEKEQQLTLVTAQVIWNGLPVDQDILQGHLIRLEQEIKDNPVPINSRSSKQVVSYLNGLGIPVKDSEVHTLMRVATESQVKAKYIMPILKNRRAAGLISKYKPEAINRRCYKGRLYGTFNQVGAGTARYSSKDPNLQQIPRAMRNIIGGEEGRLVVAPDYSQIEVRIKALLAKDTDLVAALQADDFHTFMATAMFPGRTITPELRNTGKGGTFTLNFDGGVPGIQQAAIKEGEILTRTTCQRMIEGYKKRFPISWKFNEAFRGIAANGRAQRINLPWGHYRTYETSTSQQLINNLVQGYAAVGYKEALLEMQKAGLTHYLGCLLHDEVVATGVPINEAADYQAALIEAMEVGMDRVVKDYDPDFFVPILIEGKEGSHWKK